MTVDSPLRTLEHVTVHSGQTAVVTVPSWVETPRPRTTAATRRRRALALVPAASGDEGTPLVAALYRGGYDVVRVLPGAALAVHKGSGVAEYTVRPGSREDLACVFEDQAAHGGRPEVLVHAWAAAPWPAPTVRNADETGDLGLHALRVLVREGLRGEGERTVRRLLVLTERAVDVSGADEVEPAKAALAGAIRALAAELPDVACRLVDVAGPGAFDELADELREPAPVMAALRGARRWLPEERPLPDLADGTSSGLRAGGVYLVTGGLGGLGVQVALGLARTGLRPSLALLGRHAPSAEAVSAIDEMGALGASVQVRRCDIADPVAVRAALAEVTGTAGPISGVFHLAGVAGGGVFRRRSRAEVDAVCRPKVAGTLALLAELADTPLDFFVSFSSRAAISGSKGNCDHGAANAVLDALTVHGRGPGGRRLSVNWPAWAATGPAADPLASGADVAGTRAGGAGHIARDPGGAPPAGRPEPRAELPHGPEAAVTFAAETSWVLDEHRLDGVPVMPGTGHLDLVVRTYRERLLDGARAPVVLTDVVFSKPMSAERPRSVVITLDPDRDGAHRFTVCSRPDAEPTATLVQHAAGVIAAFAGELGRVSVDDLRARFRDPVPANGGPAGGGDRGFLFGPRWLSVRDKWARPGELLVEIALPAAFVGEAARHDLHPALLDLATGTAAHFGADGLHLPFLYRRLAVPGALPPAVLAHVRGRSEKGGVVADVDVLAPDGSVVAAVEGFRMRRVEAVPAAGIAPQDGVALLLRLLAGRTPPQVHVSGH